jgi:hypothetical protein
VVAYYVLLIAAIGGLAWLFYKVLMTVFVKPEPRTQTVAEKRTELEMLREHSNDLGQEVEVTKDLAKVDSRIAELEDQLEEAENKRMPEEG